MPNRHASTADYRYGFNNTEKDDEVKGEGDSYDYEKRFYDPRVGRFLSLDPLSKKFPWYSPYQFAGNKPVNSRDLDGEEEAIVILERFDDDGKAVLSVTRNGNVMNNSNGGQLNLIFMDKNGHTDSKLIQNLQKYDSTIRSIVAGNETSALHDKNTPTYEYSLTISQDGIKTSSAKVFNVDNQIIGENGQRTGYNSGGLTFATTKMELKVDLELVAQSSATGGGGFDKSDSYINGILKPAISKMDEQIKEMGSSKNDKIEFVLGVDKDLYDNKKEYNKILDVVKQNYPNAEIKENQDGPGAHLLMWHKINDGEKQQYNKEDSDEEH